MRSMVKICYERMLGRNASLRTWHLVSYIKEGRPEIIHSVSDTKPMSERVKALQREKAKDLSHKGLIRSW